MNTEQINEAFSERFGRLDGELQGHYSKLQSDFEMGGDERADRALAGREQATAVLLQLEEERSAALAERVEDLADYLYTAATVKGYDGSVVKEDANRAQLDTIKASDEELRVMAGRATKTKNSTLASAVAAEADARGRDDITLAALQGLPKKLEAYEELRGIPSAEERAERLEQARTAIPAPSMTRIKPTAEMVASRGRVEASTRMQRGFVRG